jgi:hypothetical protein
MRKRSAPPLEAVLLCTTGASAYCYFFQMRYGNPLETVLVALYTSSLVASDIEKGLVCNRKWPVRKDSTVEINSILVGFLAVVR